MANEDTQRYMEMQMDELKSTMQSVKESTPKVSKKNEGKNAEIAALYEDAAECEKDIEGFQAELDIVNSSELKNIVASLTKELPNDERDYEKELKDILEASWKHFVEVENTHPKEEFEFIRETKLPDIIEKFSSSFPEYNGNFEMEVKALLVKRLEALIAIKKEHLKEEITDIKISGLKPTYAKRIYKQYHGID